MEQHIPTYDEAFALLLKYTSDPRHIEHARAVEATMVYLAKKYGEDVEKWRIIGLVHDLDMEKFPKEHCIKTGEILKAEGWPEEYIHGIQAHGWGTWCDVEPANRMEMLLFTIDKLTWFVSYVTVKQPSKRLANVDTRLVMSKWADESFAPGRNRGVIKKGIAALDMSLEELVSDIIAALRPVADNVGL